MGCVWRGSPKKGSQIALSKYRMPTNASCPPGLRMTNLRVLCTMDELVMGCRVDRERHIWSRLFAFRVRDVFYRPCLGGMGLKSRLL